MIGTLCRAASIVTLWLLLTITTRSAFADDDQRPGVYQSGSLYREFELHNGGNNDWRVTDEAAVEKFEAAADHLPNATMRLTIDDLRHAVRAEILLDRWGGHRGTINKRIAINGNEAIVIPEPGEFGAPLPRGLRGEMLMFQDNPVVDVPLSHLREGVNTIIADCDEEGGFGWGQWGLYSAVVRVFYDASAKGEDGEFGGRVVTPRDGDVLAENPTIRVDPSATMGVARVEILADYEGYDEDGDGDHGGFHESRFQLTLGQRNRIDNHVATLRKRPYQTTWSTSLVPDQAAGSIRLLARVQNSRGYWWVMPPVTDLSLQRDASVVRTYHCTGVPEDFAVRVGETKGCDIDIPSSDDLSNAVEAYLHLRTWHGWDGHHEPLRLNDYELPVAGKNHHYDYDRLEIPVDVLRQGNNRFSITSETEHHMLEVLWPGPSLTVRYARPLAAKNAAAKNSASGSEPSTPNEPPAVRIETDTYLDRPHYVVHTAAATYWIDDASGGMSRLIDPAGNDWIDFKMKPWDEYPASAASSFRGLPNAVFGGDHSGFGHPGWDVANTVQDGDRRLISTTKDGQWKLTWEFDATAAHLTVTPPGENQRYWFLYEGPIAGRFAPRSQTIAADGFAGDADFVASDDRLDYFHGRRLYRRVERFTLTDQDCPYRLSLRHANPDTRIDTASYLGQTDAGVDADDGMVVVGFGRGRGLKTGGIEPLLVGENRFIIQLQKNAPHAR